MNFFEGRYGWDKLSKVILLISLILMMFRYTFPIGFAFAIYAFWRALSRDIVARGNEATKFENWIKNKLYDFTINKSYNYNKKGRKGFSIKEMINDSKLNFQEKRKYKIISCPKCGQRLRLPRGKGRIIVTCKKCLSEFKERT